MNLSLKGTDLSSNYVSTDEIPLRYLVFDDDDEAENQYKRNVKLMGMNVPIYINPTDFFIQIKILNKRNLCKNNCKDRRSKY
jgi:hypothetical protein